MIKEEEKETKMKIISYKKNVCLDVSKGFRMKCNFSNYDSTREKTKNKFGIAIETIGHYFFIDTNSTEQEARKIASAVFREIITATHPVWPSPYAPDSFNIDALLTPAWIEQVLREGEE